MSNETRQETTTDQQLVVPPKQEKLVVQSDLPTMDTAKYEHMYRIAVMMARTTTVPDTLCKDKDGNFLQPDVIVANCMRIVNQAVRWGMDPYAVMDCASIVYGKLCYEGKLVAAVVSSKLGVRFEYHWNSLTGDKYGVTVVGIYPDGRTEEISGAVGEWKTTGKNSNWGKDPRMMLAYRGVRVWARLHEPAILMGVYTPDELSDLSDNARAQRARPVEQSSGLKNRLLERAQQPDNSGFQASSVAAELDGEQANPLDVVAEDGRKAALSDKPREVPQIYEEDDPEVPVWLAAYDEALNEGDASDE